MARKLCVPLALAAALAACAQPTPEQQFVNDAAAALGGRDRVLAVETLVIEGEGRAGNLGQDMTWEATGQSFTISPYRRAIDLARRRARIEQTRTPNFLYFRGPQPQRQVFGIDGDIVYDVAPDGSATRSSAAAAEDRRREIYHHPLTIVRAALDGSATVANVRAGADGRTADVTAGGTTFTFVLDANGIPSRIASPGYHPNLGDVTVETRFADYQDADGLRLPARLTTSLDRHRAVELRVSRYAVNADAGDLAAPAAVANAAPAAPPAPSVEATEVARGVWWLAGQSHHSVLVEFADHLMLIEAPQSEARTLAVIARARELVPGKPLTRLVTSHHHFDHTAGLRAAIAEGLAVITHEANAGFVEEIAKRPHTRQPDALQRNPRPATVETVDDALVLKDAAMTVELYHIAGNPHADTLLMAYFPRDRVLVEVDAYSPASTYHPYAANLLENIQKRKLRVDRIVPLHGTIAPFSGLGKAAGTATN